MYIYVLQCQSNKWYIGKSVDFTNRFIEHVTKNGSAWTIKYPPIEIFDVKPLSSKFDEDNLTMEYMDKYGIDNVRGGAYVQVYLPDVQRNEIERKLSSANDTCFNCKQTGHMINKCPTIPSHNVQLQTRNREIVAKNSIVSKPSNSFHYSIGNKQRNAYCYKCGRKGHYSNTCYAKTSLKGKDNFNYYDSDDSSSSSY